MARRRLSSSLNRIANSAFSIRKNGAREHYEIVKKYIRKRTLMETLKTRRGERTSNDKKRAEEMREREEEQRDGMRRKRDKRNRIGRM